MPKKSEPTTVPADVVANPAETNSEGAPTTATPATQDDGGKLKAKSNSETSSTPSSATRRRRLGRPTKKQLLIGGGVIAVLGALIAVQPTRNLVVGSVVKTSTTIEVYDEFKDEDSGATQRLALSGVTIKVDGHDVASNVTSPITLTKLKPGKHTLTISKPNYQTTTLTITANLSLGRQHNSSSQKLSATGRPTIVSVTNSISGEAVEGASVSVESSNAKTDKTGQAVLVVPVASKDEYELKISRDGYNLTTQKVKIPAKPSKKATELHVGPAGKIYFLSKQSGKIDVVKTNLDGSDRKIVLAGTGAEENGNTSMIATTDWRYLALSTKRADKKFQLILIDTKTDTQSTIDEGNAQFTLSGWSGKYLVYNSDNLDAKVASPGKYKIKTFNAETKKLAVIFTNAAAGTVTYGYTSEAISDVRIVNGRVLYYIYPVTWSYPADTKGRLTIANVDGSGIRTLHTHERKDGYLNLVYTSADEAYYSVTNYQGNSSTAYYEVDKNGNFKGAEKPTKTDQYTYFSSPDNKHTLWSEELDGKQAVFLGDPDGSNAKKLYSLSELKPYGWFTENYALYSKNNSELYIASVKEGATPKLVSDYHRPSLVNFQGYGGGYGGAYGN